MPSRAKKWIGRLTMLAGIALVVVVALYFAVLPIIVESQIHGALREAGIDHAQFVLRRVGLNRMELVEIGLGRPQWLRARRIEVDYSLQSFWNRRATSIKAQGVEWQIRIDADGRIAWGPPLKATPSGALQLPVDHIDIEESVVVINWNGQELRIPMAVTLVPTPSGALDITLESQESVVALRNWNLNAKKVHAQARLNTADLAADGLRGFFDAIEQGQVSIDIGSLAESSAGVEITGIRATIPIVPASDSTAAGEFTIDTIAWRGQTLHGPQGNLAIRDGIANLAANWTPVSNVGLTGNGWLAMDGARPKGELHLSSLEGSPIDLGKAAALRDLVPPLHDANLAGQVEVRGHVRLQGGEIHPLITLRAENLQVHNDFWPVQIDSASGEIIINGLAPLTTPANQTIAIHTGHAGVLKMMDGEVGFSVAGANDITIERAAWSMGDMGRFTLDGFRVDPTRPRIRTTLTGTEIQFAPWLALLTDEQVTGQGTLSGLVFLDIYPARRRYPTVGEGVFEASAEGGFVQFHDKAAVDQMLSASDLGGDERLNQVRDRVVAALANFQYSTLHVEFESEDRDVVCRIETAGVGREGENPQEIGGLNLNVHNFNHLLHFTIWAKSSFFGDGE